MVGHALGTAASFVCQGLCCKLEQGRGLEHGKDQGAGTVGWGINPPIRCMHVKMCCGGGLCRSLHRSSVVHVRVQ